MQNIIGVRFRPVGKIYYFEPDEQSYEFGDGAIVETARGVEFGRVALPPREVEGKGISQPLKRIIRKADGRDYAQLARNRARRDDALREAKARVARHELDMKLVDAEFTFDGAKVIFYFTSENRVDFRELVKDLASFFRIRIELRQIGIRDETKMKGGLGPCGRPCCCASYLTDFARVSIKMAKTQGLSLNPGKISGLCGRLMCCLAYENEHYAASSKLIPPVGAEVQTPDGKGRVVSVNLLKLIARVKVEKEGGLFEFKEYPASDLKGKRAMAEETKAAAEEDEELLGLEDDAPQKNREPAEGRSRKKERPAGDRRREGGQTEAKEPGRREDRRREGRPGGEDRRQEPGGGRNERRGDRPGREHKPGQGGEKAKEPIRAYNVDFGHKEHKPEQGGEKPKEPIRAYMDFGHKEHKPEQGGEKPKEPIRAYMDFGHKEHKPEQGGEKPKEPIRAYNVDFGHKEHKPEQGGEKAKEPIRAYMDFGHKEHKSGQAPAQEKPKVPAEDRWSGLASRVAAGSGQEPDHHGAPAEKVETTPQNT